MSPTVPIAERAHRKITVYTAESDVRHPWLLVADMVRDIASSRELAWQLFRRNMSAQYRQSVLGYLWILLPPLVTTLIWVFLSKTSILNIGHTNVPYPVYVLTGNLLWQGFARTLLMPIQSVQREQSSLTKLNFPREALLMAGFYEAVLNAIMPLVLLVPVCLWYQVPFSGYQLMAPVGFAGLILFGYALGLLAAPVGLLFSDISRAIPIATQFLFFLTPIVYPVPTAFPAVLVARLNPVTPLLTSARDWLTGQPAAMAVPFLWISAATFLLLVFGLLAYRLAMPHIVARMSA